MKKLKNNEKGDSSHRVDKYSWILLRALFERIPPKPLAVILSENKFLSILKDALDTLGELVGNQNDSPTSQSMDGSPGADTAKRGRKRKRPEGEPASPAVISSWVDVLVALLESISKLVSHLSRIPPSQVAVRSQLKLVLKGEPEMAARILGQTLHHASNACTKIRKSMSDSTNTPQIIHALLSIITIWESRSDHTADVENLSNVSMTPLFPPSLTRTNPFPGCFYCTFPIINTAVSEEHAQRGAVSR